MVLRVFDRQLGNRLEQSFGFRHVWSTSAIAAPWFVGAALGLEVLFTFYVGNHPFLLARLRVSTGGGLDGMAMLELPGEIRVAAIRRAASANALEHPPRRDTRLAPRRRRVPRGPLCGAARGAAPRSRRPSRGAVREAPRSPRAAPRQPGATPSSAMRAAIIAHEPLDRGAVEPMARGGAQHRSGDRVQLGLASGGDVALHGAAERVVRDLRQLADGDCGHVDLARPPRGPPRTPPRSRPPGRSASGVERISPSSLS